jgi:two-component system sensor histidine kinase YesM
VEDVIVDKSWKKRRRTVFLKIILVFIFFTIIMSSIAYYIFEKNIDSLTEQFKESVQNQIVFNLEKIENELSSIDIQQRALISEEELSYLSFQNIEILDYDTAKAVNRLTDKLYYMEGANPYIQETMVDILSLQRSVGFINGSRQYQDLDMTLLKLYLSQINPQSSYTTINGELYMLTLPVYYNDEFENLTFLIRTKFSIPGLLDWLRQYSNYSTSSYGLFFDKIDFHLASEDWLIEVYEQNRSEVQNSTSEAIRTQYNNENYLLLSHYSEAIGAYYIQAVPEKIIFSSTMTFRDWFLALGGVLALAVGLYILYIYRVVELPMRILIRAFEGLENENFNIKINRKASEEFSTVYQSFNKMVEKLNKLIQDVYIQKILNQKSQLRQLQAQINPHFYYNSFFMLRNRIANKQYEDAEQFCDMLGRYYLYLNKNNKDIAPLSEEVEYAKIYAEIQAQRFKDRIQVHFDDLPEQYKDMSVPKLILQPIIENSFKYGLEEKEFEGQLRISFDDDGKYLYIHIEDNGERFNFLSDQNKLDEFNQLFDIDSVKFENDYSGLMNIKMRLRLYFNSQSDLIFSKSDLGGLKTTLKLRSPQGGDG